MNAKRLVLATAMITALSGIYGCSKGDDATINIDAPTTNTTNNTTGGDGGDGGTGTALTCPNFAGLKKDIEGNDVCAISGVIDEDIILTSDKPWLLEGQVVVGNGDQSIDEYPDGAQPSALENGNALLHVTLTIEAGTEVKFEQGGFSNLVVSRGSKIHAVGSATAPIIFSSEDSDYDGGGEWGGIQMSGFAPNNQTFGEPSPQFDGEGNVGFAGGLFPEDNSGELSYVVITEGGYEFAPGDEINGLSLHAIGSGTTIDHIQVNNNTDDGIEFYGGAVNIKYVVLTSNLDDSLDWDEGFQGNIQYALIKQSPDGEGQCIEADTFGSHDPAAEQSKPTIANMTCLAVSNEAASGKPYALRLKEGTSGFIHNSIISVIDTEGFVVDCVNVAGAEAQANRNTLLVINNFISDCQNFGDDVLDRTTVYEVDAQIDGDYASQAPEAQLSAPISWDEVNATWSNSVADGSFLDETDYLGAVEPGGTAWWQGWTLPGTL